jgi:hypothetical protein
MNRTDSIQLTLSLEPPLGGDDLAAHMAFLRGAALAHYATSEMRRSVLYMVDLTVPDDWSREDHDAFEADLARALHLLRGMPWLREREVLAYMAAERAVEQVEDERASELFAVLRQTDKTGWDAILAPVAARLRSHADDAALSVGLTTAAAALMALDGLLGLPALRRQIDSLQVELSDAALRIEQAEQRVADLEHLPDDLADVVSRADFIERTVIIFRERVQALDHDHEAKLSDIDYVLNDVLGPVIQAELDKQFDDWDKKLLGGIAKWVFKQAGGEIVGDQIDLKLPGPE